MQNNDKKGVKMSYTSNLINFDIALNNLIQQSGLQVDLLYYIFKSKTNL